MDVKNIKSEITEKFLELPKVIQQAVTDASIEEKLRKLAKQYNLHMDQWVLLENEIMFAILGIEDPKNMAKNISKEINIGMELAQKIVNDIAVQIFRPIHEIMEKETSGNHRKLKSLSQKEIGVKTSPIDTTTYKPGENSRERRTVQEDPYRESII